MRGIGFDTSAEYCAAAQNRLDKMQNAQMSSEEGIQGQLTHGAEGFANLLLTTKRGAADLEHKAFSDLLKNASMGYYQRRPVKAHWEHAVWFCAHGGVGTLIHCHADLILPSQRGSTIQWGFVFFGHHRVCYSMK